MPISLPVIRRYKSLAITHIMATNSLHYAIWTMRSLPLMTRNPPRIPFVIFTVFLISSTILAACRTNPPSKSNTDGLAMASMSGMPAEVKSAPTTVQQAYQFAVANSVVLKQIPCYCGCGKIGHTSNYACYVKNAAENGSITYDDHALGCSICVDITQ